MGHWKHFREPYTFQKQFPDGPEVEQGLLLYVISTCMVPLYYKLTYLFILLCLFVLVSKPSLSITHHRYILTREQFKKTPEHSGFRDSQKKHVWLISLKPILYEDRIEKQQIQMLYNNSE